jgi:hypothetical protein
MRLVALSDNRRRWGGNFGLKLVGRGFLLCVNGWGTRSLGESSIVLTREGEGGGVVWLEAKADERVKERMRVGQLKCLMTRQCLKLNYVSSILVGN